MSALQFKLTRAGLAMLASTQRFTIDAVGFGDRGYAPAGNETALRSQRERVAVGSGAVNGNTVTLQPVLTSNLDFLIREIGIYLDDGTLFALWSHASTTSGHKTQNTQFEMLITLVIEGVSAERVTINVVEFGRANLTAHIERVDNPHSVTRAQLEAAGKAEFDAHNAKRNNPHSVTRAQLRAAGKVEFDVHNAKRNNPHSVTRAQLEAAGKVEFDVHNAKRNNPHSVTRAQLRAAGKAEFDAHNDNTNNPHSVTRAQLEAAGKAEFDAHNDNTNNPHSVTLAQLGTLSSEEIIALIDGREDKSYYVDVYASGRTERVTALAWAKALLPSAQDGDFVVVRWRENQRWGTGNGYWYGGPTYLTQYIIVGLTWVYAGNSQ